NRVLQRKLFGREAEKKEKPHIYIYGRTRLHLFMRHKHGQISTRKDENFYSERQPSHAVGTGNASACVFGSEEIGHKKCLFSGILPNEEAKNLFKFSD
ncbi:hypothetical protein, partial [Bacteroides caecicola]|uniref:hypothetical protein n=1 Tax=Bacteroides caecicola TaxID=1462569 RepID=UPI0019585845